MITTKSKCFSNIQVGDSVALRLLPFEKNFKTLEGLFVLPVIGYNWGTPFVGTSEKFLYDNHRFRTTSYHFITEELCKWKYFLPLNSLNIEIESVIKGGAKFSATHRRR